MFNLGKASFSSNQLAEPILLAPAATTALDFMQRESQGRQAGRMGAGWEQKQAVHLPVHWELAATPGAMKQQVALEYRCKESPITT